MRAPRTKSEMENKPMFPPLPILKAPPLPLPPVVLVVEAPPVVELVVPVVELVVPVVALATKCKVPKDTRLEPTNSCFCGKPVVLSTPGPTCQTWLTDSAFLGTLTVANILYVPLENSTLTSQTSNDSFPGTMEV